MSTPMDRPPADHGADRYDYVELSWPPGTEQPPLPSWLTADFKPCPDCNANLFLSWRPERVGECTGSINRGVWDATVAHDDGCPVLRQHEERG